RPAGGAEAAVADPGGHSPRRPRGRGEGRAGVGCPGTRAHGPDARSGCPRQGAPGRGEAAPGRLRRGGPPGGRSSGLGALDQHKIVQAPRRRGSYPWKRGRPHRRGATMPTTDTGTRQEFFTLLAAPGRSPEISESDDLYGWLVGSWELQALRYW